MYRHWIWPVAAATLGVCLVATQVVGESEPPVVPPLIWENSKQVAQEVGALVAEGTRQEARLLAALESPKLRFADKEFAVQQLFKLHRREIIQRAIRKLATRGDPQWATGRSIGPAGRAMPFPYQDLMSQRCYHASRELKSIATSRAADEETIKGVVRLYRAVWGAERAEAIFRALKSQAETKWHPDYDRVLRQFEVMADSDVSSARKPPK